MADIGGAVARIAALAIGIIWFVIPEGASSALGLLLIGWGLGADELLDEL